MMCFSSVVSMDDAALEEIKRGPGRNAIRDTILQYYEN